MIYVRIGGNQRAEGKSTVACLVRDYLRRIGYDVDFVAIRPSQGESHELTRRMEKYHPVPEELDSRDVKVIDLG